MRTIDNTLTGQIITLVCEAWGVTRSELVSHSRKQPLPWARSQLCQYLRIYAGHDGESCGAIVRLKARSVQLYQTRYQHNLDTVVPFRDKDTLIKNQIKAIIQK